MTSLPTYLLTSFPFLSFNMSYLFIYRQGLILPRLPLNSSVAKDDLELLIASTFWAGHYGCALPYPLLVSTEDGLREFVRARQTLPESFPWLLHLFFFLDRFFFYSPGWLWIPSHPPASISPVLGLKASATTTRGVVIMLWSNLKSACKGWRSYSLTGFCLIIKMTVAND